MYCSSGGRSMSLSNSLVSNKLITSPFHDFFGKFRIVFQGKFLRISGLSAPAVGTVKSQNLMPGGSLGFRLGSEQWARSKEPLVAVAAEHEAAFACPTGRFSGRIRDGA